jgi:hypothetical protein
MIKCALHQVLYYYALPITYLHADIVTWFTEYLLQHVHEMMMEMCKRNS